MTRCTMHKTRRANKKAAVSEKAVLPPKSEDEKSMRGTVSLYRNEKTGARVYLRGKKIFLKTGVTIPTRQVDSIEAGYYVRREYASGEDKSVLFIHPKLAKCKWGAEASLKLDKMLK